MNKEDLFNIIDNLLQDCYNETIDREDYDLEEYLMKTLSINDEKTINKIIELIYKNVELYTLKLKDATELVCKSFELCTLNLKDTIKNRVIDDTQMTYIDYMKEVKEHE